MLKSGDFPNYFLKKLLEHLYLHCLQKLFAYVFIRIHLLSIFFYYVSTYFLQSVTFLKETLLIDLYIVYFGKEFTKCSNQISVSQFFFQSYFKDSWNTFDFVTVVGSIVDALMVEFAVSLNLHFYTFAFDNVHNFNMLNSGKRFLNLCGVYM